MSEHFPQQDPKEIQPEETQHTAIDSPESGSAPTDDSASDVDAQRAEGEARVAAEYDESQPKAAEPSGPWDKDKALAMASILQDGSATSDVNYAKQYLDMQDVRSEVEKKESQIRGTQELLDKAAARGANITSLVKLLEVRKDELRALRRVPAAEAAEKQDQKLRASGEYVTGIANEALAPFEELYDVNPNKFSVMPTGEFIDIMRSITKQKGEIKRAEHDLGTVTNNIENCQDLLEAADAEMVIAFLDGVKSWPNASFDVEGVDADAAYDRVQQIKGQMFDHSPRESVEAYRALLEEYHGKLQSAVDTLKKTLEDQLDSYRRETHEAEGHLDVQ